MSDDLAKRLRSFDCITMNGCGRELRHEAADRIEELQAENGRLRELLSGFYASEDIEDLLSGWMIWKVKGDSDG